MLHPALLRVAICDDSLPMRVAIGAMLEESGAFEPGGQASNGIQAVELVERSRPDVLVLDLDMPHYDGLYAIRRIRAFDRELPIVVYSGGDRSARAEALRAGATVFVDKASSVNNLVEALADVAADLRRA